MLAGCTAFVSPDLPSAGYQYDLVGRMRIKADDAILRLDFHMAYDGTKTALQVWGPMGVNRTKVTFGRDQYIVERRNGDVIFLRPEDLSLDLPLSGWQIGPDLGPWLRLQPFGVTQPKATDNWALNGVEVEVQEKKTVDGELVCKRLKMASGTAEVLVLCDRWRFLN